MKTTTKIDTAWMPAPSKNLTEIKVGNRAVMCGILTLGVKVAHDSGRNENGETWSHDEYEVVDAVGWSDDAPKSVRLLTGALTLRPAPVGFKFVKEDPAPVAQGMTLYVHCPNGALKAGKSSLCNLYA